MSETNTKKPWQSKTVWTNLILAVVAFMPSVGDWFQANPQVIVVLFTVVNLILRAVTKDKIELLD